MSTETSEASRGKTKIYVADSSESTQQRTTKRGMQPQEYPLAAHSQLPCTEKSEASRGKRKSDMEDKDGKYAVRKTKRRTQQQEEPLCTQHSENTGRKRKRVVGISTTEPQQQRTKKRTQLEDDPMQVDSQVRHTDSGIASSGREYLYLGDPEYKCPKCEAIMWFEERIKKTSTKKLTRFNMCCRDGKIRLIKVKPPPEFLYRLMTTNESEAIMFRQNIRLYNSCYSFTSMGAKIDKTVNKRPASELLLRERTIGKEEGSPKLDQGIMLQLKDMLDEVNPLTQVFRMAQERIREDNDVQLSIRLLGSRNKKDKVYNNPTASEIAALIVSPEGSTTKGRDIVIDHKSTGLQTISELHPSYMALQYPLLFPYGEDNYHLDIPYYTDQDKPETSRRKNVTMREYYAYRIQQRISEGHIWLCGGRLFQQFLVDCCCAIESDRLWYIKNNQDLFRCDILNNICDAVEKGDLIGHAVGKRFYLPPSFTGSPRYMYQSYQDAMAICRWYGNPHLFITFTANSRWPEIEAMLKYIPNQRPEDRPDIVARVFKLKLKQLLHCLKTERYFGTTIAGTFFNAKDHK
ncbi:uncharacterized protein LOC141608023 [Silene latifolia]|uniref:uncharacterized protein LOC141608023 n=1 Tax=Silene latifolia TaxID=37657 RepID=UPI003D77DCCA